MSSNICQSNSTYFSCQLLYKLHNTETETLKENMHTQTTNANDTLETSRRQLQQKDQQYKKIHSTIIALDHSDM